MNDRIMAGFTYTIEQFDARGRLVDIETVHNIMPYEGLNYMITAAIRGGTVLTAWYVGLYSGNYTPLITDGMGATTPFPTAATEFTAYTPTARQVYTGSVPSNGSSDNSAAPAVFTMTSAATIYGGFIASNSTQGSTSGTLLSAVKFASPKVLDVSGQLRVTAGFLFTSS